MPIIDDVLRANEEYTRTFDRGHLPLPPARRLAIVTCMDARIDPGRAFGLREGDAHVIRNAGGLARDALRSLVISQRLLGTNEIAVIHHTDCGMLTFTNAHLHVKVRQDLGADATGIDFLPFSDLETSVQADLAFLRTSPLIAKETVIRGFLYDVRTGRLSEVTPQGAGAVTGLG
jgi:carbonic anhydrase